MSGIEILGVAAGVLQIAELGGKLSVKLFTFTRKIKNADKHIDSISQDIAYTGAVLQQLGNELKKDEHLRLCSAEAVTEARGLMEACQRVFEELNDAIDGKGKGRGAGKWLSVLKQKINYPFLEEQIGILKAKLEHLKSSLLVMLNVLIFAGQLRGNEALPVLQDQRELLKQLVEEKTQNQRQYELVLKRLDQLHVGGEGPSSSSASAISNETSATSSSMTLVSTNSSSSILTAQEKEHEILRPHLPMHLHDRAEEIFDHCRLVRALVEEVNHAQYKLDLGIKYRAQQKILESHWEEWEKLWAEHQCDVPADVRYRLFEHYPLLKRFWSERYPPPAPTANLESKETVPGRLPNDKVVTLRKAPPDIMVASDEEDQEIKRKRSTDGARASRKRKQEQEAPLPVNDKRRRGLFSSLPPALDISVCRQSLHLSHRD
jgi:hypothetical protein